ncbi:spore protease YyaC [Geosporobacter ferrireducens]|uniref:Spore protease YyaC n=2 Tax=Geosporobacter ferrireducens TaxID=1424294 RepID=A0A1D8GQ76_9FIRM|nr:spore protease YyaC [Geosporobacter ferrireducens]
MVLCEVLKAHMFEQTIILCIGTDRCIGDALGPLVGTLLENRNFRYPLYGSLDHPIHAINLESSLEKIKTEHPDAYVIAIDACLGQENLIGNIHIKNGPIYPGKGVGKSLPQVGHLSIVGIVDKLQNDDLYAIHHIRLSLIMHMAQIIADAFMLATYLS